MRFGCVVPSCRRRVKLALTLRGRVSRNTRVWYTCPHHAQIVREMIKSMHQRYDVNGVMELIESEVQDVGR
jgi:hypothetical protein